MGSAELKAVRILVVDDLPEVREWIAALLESLWRERNGLASAQVVRLSGGLELRRSVERDRPDLVLLDEVLGTGEDVGSLLTWLQGARIPVCLMSSVVHLQDRPEGVWGRLKKPRFRTGVGEAPFRAELNRVLDALEERNS